MKTINTCDNIKSMFSNGFEIDLWREYANGISNELSRKCENDCKKYNFNNDILPIINSALDEEKMDLVSNAFDCVINTLNNNLMILFDKEPNISIILYLGLCNGAGWATSLNGEDTVLLGIEKIIELGWCDEKSMRSLIFHEIGHLWHKINGNLYIHAFTKRRKAIQQLYQEGVAMVCEQALCNDDELYHQNVNGWLDWCYDNEIDIKREYLKRLQKNESVQDFFGDWCSYEGYSDVGYFLGCRFIRYLMNDYSLLEIANMNYHVLNDKFVNFAS